MSIVWLHKLHVTCAVLTAAGFLLRGWMLWRRPQWLRRRPVRTLPHVIDTVLLASGLAMLFMFGYGSAPPGWLIAKLVALLVYIGLGMIALRFGRSAGQRLAAWIGAVLVLGYIFSVALTKGPFGYLAWM
ncbi:MAG: SirB2 family protein [Chromatiales bacterium]|jgi:uncharacterized membrane protein SirB2|nr:SirB2 family protein [Chromatiales bacterium]